MWLSLSRMLLLFFLLFFSPFFFSPFCLLATSSANLPHSYRDQAALDKHMAGEGYAQLTQAFKDEGLVSQAPTMLTLTSVAGFDHRL